MKCFLVLLIFASFFSYANDCVVERFQPIDIESNTTIVERNIFRDSFDILRTSPMRCATVTFSSKYTRKYIARELNDDFEVTYSDGKKALSTVVNFDKDDLKAGYIKFRRNSLKNAYICFTVSETPISEITCLLK